MRSGDRVSGVTNDDLEALRAQAKDLRRRRSVSAKQHINQAKKCRGLPKVPTRRLKRTDLLPGPFNGAAIPAPDLAARREARLLRKETLKNLTRTSFCVRTYSAEDVDGAACEDEER